MCLLENLRFHTGEKKNDPGFAAHLSAPAQAYVDDAFGTAHRAHASVVGVAERIARKAAGRLLVGEVAALGGLLENPGKPFVAIVGGAKIDTKLAVLENLLPRLDVLVLGGGMANTFLAAQGHDMADSLMEADRIPLASGDPRPGRRDRDPGTAPLDLVVTDDLDNPTRDRDRRPPTGFPRAPRR